MPLYNTLFHMDVTSCQPNSLLISYLDNTASDKTLLIVTHYVEKSV